MQNFVLLKFISFYHYLVQNILRLACMLRFPQFTIRFLLGYLCCTDLVCDRYFLIFFISYNILFSEYARSRRTLKLRTARARLKAIKYKCNSKVRSSNKSCSLFWRYYNLRIKLITKRKIVTQKFLYCP